MAAAILRTRATAAGLPMLVSSAGTGSWHTGRPAHPATVAELATRGIAITHAARTFTARDFAQLDLVLAMDHANLAHLDAIAPTAADRSKIRLIRDFDPAGPAGLHVPDPYYGGPEDYRAVFEMLDAACGGLIASVIDGAPHARTGAGRCRR
jgi:protein-tyrosine phosphatase